MLVLMMMMMMKKKKIGTLDFEKNGILVHMNVILVVLCELFHLNNY